MCKNNVIYHINNFKTFQIARTSLSKLTLGSFSSHSNLQVRKGKGGGRGGEKGREMKRRGEEDQILNLMR